MKSDFSIDQYLKKKSKVSTSKLYRNPLTKQMYVCLYSLFTFQKTCWYPKFYYV